MRNEFKATLVIAIPLILSNLTQIAYSLIDTAMIGILGYKELAAASLVSNVIAIPMVIGMGLMMAITPLVAIANGQKNSSKSSHLLYNGWGLSIVVGVLLALIVHVIAYFLIDMGQDVAVAALSKTYLIIMGYSLIPMMVFIACKHFSDGLQFTKTSMLLSLISLPLNAFLCWIFIYGKWGIKPMGVNGAGLATLISRLALAIAMFIVVFKHKVYAPYRLNKKQNWYFKKSTLKEIFAIGIPGSLQFCMEAGAFSISGIMVGWLGAVQQAAHQIALNCASATFMIALGFSLAGSIRVSNAFGRGDLQSIFSIGKSTAYTGLIYGAIAGILLILLGQYLPDIFSTNKEVVSLATSLLIFAAIFQISDATQAIGVGLCRGVKDVIRPTIYVAIAYWIIGIPMGYLLAFYFKMGAAGIWIGLVVGLTLSSILLNFRFFNNLKFLSIN